jgi:hypothetical protein
MDNGAAVGEVPETVNSIPRVAVCRGVPLSRTSAVKTEVPVVVGVPETTPLLVRVKPVGSAPDATLHVYGVFPPAALRVTEYAVSSFPAASEVVVISSTAASALISTDKLFVAVCLGEAESATSATNEKVPGVVGVPEITPAAPRVRPAGIAPELMLHV